MLSTLDTRPALGAIDEKRVLDLEQRSIRTPSSTFEEGISPTSTPTTCPASASRWRCSRSPIHSTRNRRAGSPLGGSKARGGTDTSHKRPHGPRRGDERLDRRPLRSQVRGRLDLGYGRARRQGRLCRRHLRARGHRSSGTRLRGDVLMTPVVAHKLGGAGTRALLQRHQGGPVHQHGALQQHDRQCLRRHRHGAAHLLGARAFLPLQPGGRAAYMNPIEQQMEIVRRIGPSLTPIAPAAG